MNVDMCLFDILCNMRLKKKYGNYKISLIATMVLFLPIYYILGPHIYIYIYIYMHKFMTFFLKKNRFLVSTHPLELSLSLRGT